LLVVLVAGAGVAGKIALSDCSLSHLRPVSLGENSFLYAADGTLLGAIPSATNRQPLSLRHISPWLPKATIAIEDRRFYSHGALDYRAILRAAFADLRAGRIVEGGSTITQELVRNLYIGSSVRTLGRKIEEACLANKLADRWTKREILAAYLNEVFYGNRAYGAEAGAQTYFSRSARSLTLPQAALLAGLPQAPSVYDPLKQPEFALDRRNEVLSAMLRANDITQAEYDWAVGTPLGLKPGKLYTDVHHPNFFGYAEQQLVSRYGQRRVEAGGLVVKTTVEPRLQAAAQQALVSHLHSKDDPAGAVVAISPGTGAIRAMESWLPGGRHLQFNLATQSGRQAGSAFKPFVLTTALEQGIPLDTYFSGPSEYTVDDPTCEGADAAPWTVHNYADESSGTMNLIDATAHSVNTIYAQLVAKVGPANVVTTAHRMGIRSPLKPVCSITLGSQAVNPLEMTDAYATLAARGVHHAPQALALVTSRSGSWLGRLRPDGARAMPQPVADTVTSVLQTVVQYGTGTAAALADRPVAGKTGTAENYEDAWFCGYVPQLATCVWVGYPSREIPLLGVEGVPEVFGGSIPAEIWHDFMTAAAGDLPVRQFAPPPSGVDQPAQVTYTPPYTPPTQPTPAPTTTEAAPPPPVTTTTAAPPPPPSPPPPPHDHGHGFGHGHDHGHGEG
jgi:penicillin-binding protein 1A